MKKKVPAEGLEWVQPDSVCGICAYPIYAEATSKDGLCRKHSCMIKRSSSACPDLVRDVRKEN